VDRVGALVVLVDKQPIHQFHVHACERPGLDQASVDRRIQPIERERGVGWDVVSSLSRHGLILAGEDTASLGCLSESPLVLGARSARRPYPSIAE
jgi:hypothetical protein